VNQNLHWSKFIYFLFHTLEASVKKVKAPMARAMVNQHLHWYLQVLECGLYMAIFDPRFFKPDLEALIYS
jgi:hypothetical protein